MSKRVLWEAHTSERIEKLEKNFGSENVAMVEFRKEIAELKMDIKNIIGDEKDFLDDINELREVLQEVIKYWDDFPYMQKLLQQLEGEKKEPSKELVRDKLISEFLKDLNDFLHDIEKNYGVNSLDVKDKIIKWERRRNE